jgi:para-aminobenzoate synthetase component 1
VSDSVIVHSLPADLTVEEALAPFLNEDLCILLDSATRPRIRDARYSFLTADPLETVRLERPVYGQDPFDTLRGWQQRLPEIDHDDAPPFCGGIMGMMSYELGEAFERLPRPSTDEFKTPALIAGLYDWALVWDHVAGTVQCWVILLPGDEQPAQHPARRHASQLSGSARLAWVLERLNAPEQTPAATRIEAPLAIADRYCQPCPGMDNVGSDFTRSQYLTAVDRVIEYIRAGDIFQANLSQRLVAPWRRSTLELYRNVRQRNAAPFCACLQAKDFAVVSASPERFLRVTAAGNVETRPIKGTRRRQRSPIADLFTSAALVASEKDRAENVMIVDLLRNDISRVCAAGSVRVTGLCEIERFETVQHLVSTVVGQIRPECDVWDLLAGCFPGGSITGAPKIRAMEIIAELEPTVRGAYCGSMFYLGAHGELDSSILIRTFTVKGGWLQFPAGGGVVADSVAADEYQETLHKASGMLSALTEAR